MEDTQEAEARASPALRPAWATSEILTKRRVYSSVREGLSGMLKALSLTFLTRDGDLREQWVFCPVVPGRLSCSFLKAACMIMVLRGWSNATVSQMFAVSKRGTAIQLGRCLFLPTGPLDEALE